MHALSQAICEQLNIEYIDFSIPENFIKLMDLIFKYKKHFQLNIYKRTKNFLEDTLYVLWGELDETKLEKPLELKEFACILKNESFKSSKLERYCEEFNKNFKAAYKEQNANTEQ